MNFRFKLIAICFVFFSTIAHNRILFAQEIGSKAATITPSAVVIGGGSGSGPSDPETTAPEDFAISPGGVDMRTGQYIYTHRDLNIGDENGMNLTRTPLIGGLSFKSTDWFGGLSHNWDISIQQKRIPVPEALFPSQYDYQVGVISNSTTLTFRAQYSPSPADVASGSPSDFTELSHHGLATLDFEYSTASGYVVPTKYTYISGDGARIKFQTTGSAITTKSAFAEEVAEPNGTIYKLEYDKPGSDGRPRRLRSVNSNRGYALLFEYDPNSGLVTKICALNLTVVPMPAISAEQICPPGVRVSTYNYTASRLSSFVDQGGETTNIGPGLSAIYSAGSNVPFVTNVIQSNAYEKIVTSQQFSDGRTFNYTWNRDGNYLVSSVMGGSYIDNLGQNVSVIYGKYRSLNIFGATNYVTPGPESTTDQLGNTNTYRYCNIVTEYNECDIFPMQEKTDSEFNREKYVYDGRQNIIEIRKIAKAGSNLPDRVLSKTFNCLPNPCAGKPTSITDANGATTTYTYDPVHGGMLNETGPAVGGVSPQTRYEYAQRFAWTKNAANTGYVQAASPIWVKTKERSCKTAAASGASCAGGAADEVVSEFDYGPNAGPNNLWLRGVAVTATNSAGALETQRTCYGYDNNGHKISETSPLANLAVCP